jgi:uncharacterized protein YndB with AHSA1/START domain
MAVSFDTVLVISASPERVFSTMTDLDGWSTWMKGLVRVEKLTDGPVGVGTEWRETRKMMGKEGSEVFDITAFDPPRSMSLHVDGAKGASKKGHYRFDYRFEEEPNGPQGTATRVVMHGEIDIPGFMAKVMGKLFIGIFKNACDRDLVALKEFLEGTPEGVPA